MKKALIVISICLIANPLTVAAATKKHRKKPIAAATQVQASPAVATTTAMPTTDNSIPEKSESETPPSYLDNLSGNLGLTTNYMFRGISLSANNPAVQGGLTYTFPVGVYFNVWGSNTDYNAPDGKRVSSEFDTIMGWQGSVLEDFTYNLNFARYNYPGSRSANYNEVNTLFGYKVFQLGLSYTANYSGTHASGTYVNGILTFNLPSKYVYFEDVSFQAGMGHYSLARAAGNSYSDYLMTLTKKISQRYTIAAMWTGTNGRAHLPPYDGNQIVGTVSAYF